MNIEYYMKIQNAYGTKDKKERDLVNANLELNNHFKDTYDKQNVLVNDTPMEMIIVKDTDRNVNEKKIKTRHEDIINLGDYVYWNNQVWIIMLLDPDDKTWNRGYMYLCTTLLRWQADDCSLVERWCYTEDYTKYSSGQKGNEKILVGDYHYGITLPVDKYTSKLTRGKRFVIDYEGNYPPDTYMLTGKKAFLNNNRYFNRGGTVTYNLSYDFFNKNTDKMIEIENGTKVWICDYSSISNSQNPSIPESKVISIISGSNSLRIKRIKTWTVSFTDEQDRPIDFSLYSWRIVCDYKVSQVNLDNKIQLEIDDENSIGTSFLLQIIIDNEIVAEKEIEILESLSGD